MFGFLTRKFVLSAATAASMLAAPAGHAAIRHSDPVRTSPVVVEAQALNETVCGTSTTYFIDSLEHFSFCVVRSPAGAVRVPDGFVDSDHGFVYYTRTWCNEFECVVYDWNYRALLPGELRFDPISGTATFTGMVHSCWLDLQVTGGKDLHSTDGRSISFHTPDSTNFTVGFSGGLALARDVVAFTGQACGAAIGQNAYASGVIVRSVGTVNAFAHLA